MATTPTAEDAFEELFKTLNLDNTPTHTSTATTAKTPGAAIEWPRGFKPEKIFFL